MGKRERVGANPILFFSIYKKGSFNEYQGMQIILNDDSVIIADDKQILSYELSISHDFMTINFEIMGKKYKSYKEYETKRHEEVIDNLNRQGLIENKPEKKI